MCRTHPLRRDGTDCPLNSQQRANPAPINLDGSSSDVTSAFRDEKSSESSKLSRLAQPLHRNLLLPSCLECCRTDSFLRRHHFRQFFQTFRKCVARENIIDGDPIS